MVSLNILTAKRRKLERMNWDHQALDKEIAKVNISAKLLRSEEWFRE